MTGFLKRDWYLLSTNLRFYLCFVLAFGIFAAFTDFAATFASLYLVLFAGTSVMSLFSYDEANHWEAYAAATPNGRGAMVDARYLLAMGLGAVVFLFQLILGVLSKDGQLETALVYGGVFFLYSAVILPISYRFGGTKSRLIMIVVVAVFSALIALCATSLQIFSDGDPFAVLGFLPAFLPLLGAAVLAVSHRISRAIMAKKEL